MRYVMCPSFTLAYSAIKKVAWWACQNCSLLADSLFLCLQRSPYKMSCMGLLIPIHHSKRGCSISMIRYREWKRKNPSGFSRFHICQYLCNWAKQQTKTFLYQPNYAMVLGGVRVVVCTWKRSLRVACREEAWDGESYQKLTALMDWRGDSGCIKRRGQCCR